MKKISILSLDGGGIRGIIPGIILNYLETRLQQKSGTNLKIGDFFDFIAGTSTGGILACTYLVPGNSGTAKYSANDALQIYLEQGADIFHNDFITKLRSGFGLTDEKYAATSLEKNLNKILENCLLSQFIKPCLVTSYEITSRNAYFFTSADAKENNIYDFKAKDVARATSAAPTYFEPAKIQSCSGQTFYLIDGGVFANNPTLCAYAEARKLNFATLLNDPLKPNLPSAKDMLIISIGTGTVKKPYHFENLKNAGEIKWIQPIIDILMSGNTETVNYQIEQIYKTLSLNDKTDYYRFEPTLREASSDMDKTDNSNLENLKQAGLWFINKNKNMLDEVADKILLNR